MAACSCERTSNTNGRLAIPALVGLLVSSAVNSVMSQEYLYNIVGLVMKFSHTLFADVIA